MDKPHNYNVEKKERDPGEHTTYVKFINKVADSFVLVLRCSPLEKKNEEIRTEKNRYTDTGNVLSGSGHGSLIIHCACGLELISIVFAMVTSSTSLCSSNGQFSAPFFFYTRGLDCYVLLG